MKKATFSMASVDILNIIMDPIFIYTFHLGLKGAALATVLSTIIPTIVSIYWLFIKKNTYLNYEISNFKFKPTLIRGILNVGVPASLEEFIISVVNMILNVLLVIVAGTNVISAFNVNFSIIQLGMMPCIAIGTSAITVAGVAYGAKEYEKVKITCHYGIKISLIISLIITVLLFAFAPEIALLFVDKSNMEFYHLIIHVLRVTLLFLLVTPVGGVCAMVFQAMGKGALSLLLTFIRELFLVILIAYLIGITLNFGLNGLLIGFILGLGIGSIISLIVIEGVYEKIVK